MIITSDFRTDFTNASRADIRGYVADAYAAAELSEDMISHIVYLIERNPVLEPGDLDVLAGDVIAEFERTPAQ